MTDPTDKRDILDALLKGAPDDAPEGLDALARLIHRKVAPEPAAERQEPRRPSRSKKRPGAPQDKKKSTHYLSGDIFQDLDEAKERINRVIQERSKQHITKSRIVDQALRMILKEFEEKGEASPLFQELLKGNDPK